MARKTKTRLSPSKALLGLAALSLVPAYGGKLSAATLIEPPVLASSGGVLDILMIARPKQSNMFGLQAPVGWIYDICPNPGPGIVSCPASPVRSTAYGGTRLSLMPGDKLKVRLVNQLPMFGPTESRHAGDPGFQDLIKNPTNIHTHGLIVAPREPTVARPSWGDDVFVLGYNPKNGIPQPNNDPTATHIHGSAFTGAPIPYEIDIPRNHPSGGYWFHPHVHGIAYNQISAGLGGIITIGQAGDYACEDWNCATKWSETNVRHLILKDMQVEAADTTTPVMLDQPDPGFCAPDQIAGEAARKGICAGVAANHPGGRWHFSLNGQLYPTIPVSAPQGEIWRLTNVSGSRTYDLRLNDDNTKSDMVMQVISVDGVSVTADTIANLVDLKKLGGNKMRIVDCPKVVATGPVAVSSPVCVTSFVMYPSSRAEVWVSYRGADGHLATPPAKASATFKTVAYNTGFTGDTWPSIDLANVTFTQPARDPKTPEFVNLKGHATAALSVGGVLTTATLVNSALVPTPVALPKGSTCTPLPAGQRRRVYYGIPNRTDPNAPSPFFGLAYELIYDNGTPVDPTKSPIDVSQYDPVNPTICVPLGAGNTPVKEIWEVVNIAGENHNFHIHQTKFRVLEEGGTIAARNVAPRPIRQLPFKPGTVLHDNYPLPAGAGQNADGSGCEAFSDYLAGTCKPSYTTLEIAFSQAGDYVYHCHILEHEDGGMMARIRVARTP